MSLIRRKISARNKKREQVRKIHRRTTGVGGYHRSCGLLWDTLAHRPKLSQPVIRHKGLILAE